MLGARAHVSALIGLTILGARRCPPQTALSAISGRVWEPACSTIPNANGLLNEAAARRLGGVSRARLTQIMNLLNLAPDIQEEILFLPRVKQERQAISERQIRTVAAIADWRKQRKAWTQFKEQLEFPRALKAALNG